MSFISDFIKKAYEEKKFSLKKSKIDKKLNTKVEKKQESVNKIEKKENIRVKSIENYKETSTNTLSKSNKIENKKLYEVKKQLSFYLSSNSSLDNELHKMNELEKDLANSDKAIKSVKELRKNQNRKKESSIKIEKEKYSWKWIIIQFVLGIIFLGISYFYIQNNPAEKKFLESSVQLWINTFQSIASKFGGELGQEAEKSYIEKRKNMVLELINLEKRVNDCILDKKINLKEAKKMLESINILKNILMNYDYLPLDKFISKSDQFDLQIYSYKENIDKFCK